MTTNDRDITDRVREALDDEVPNFNVDGIVRQLIATYDLIGDRPTMTTNDIPDSEWWAIVQQHQRTEAGL